MKPSTRNIQMVLDLEPIADPTSSPTPPSHLTSTTNVKVLTMSHAILEALLSDPTTKQYINVYVVRQRSGPSRHANWRTMYRTFEHGRASQLAQWYASKYPHLEVRLFITQLVLKAES